MSIKKVKTIQQKVGEIRDAALDYHRKSPPGKLTIHSTKPLANQHDLALAYSPGVAAACEEIVRDPAQASRLTTRGNLVAVISNGTAVLGLGPIGPLASKPVMEGKAVLFKKFAGIDVFDLEVNETDPDKLVDIIASLEPTFGAINLEDIKAPECFIVERQLQKRLSIPVIHDDQHGTAIIVAAAITNGLRLVGKKMADIKLVTSGAGAAALACLDLLVAMGLKKDNIIVTDIDGVVYSGRRKTMDPFKARYARKTRARTLGAAIKNADVFLGLSVGNVLKPAMLKSMTDKPIIMALANPVPEIAPETAKMARPDAIIATGRSDLPNQVNNVICFPYLFRGALDVGATSINEEMKIACVKAIADLAMAESSEVVSRAYGGRDLTFGPDYFIPKPFDPRLIVRLAPAVARAAMDSGVASRPITDFKSYRQRLIQFVFQTGTIMNPVFDQAARDPKRIAYAEGEERRVLQAVQQVIDEGLARPLLVGRTEVINRRIAELGLAMVKDRDFDVINPVKDKRCLELAELYHGIKGRAGISPDEARRIVRTQATALAALLLMHDDVDAMLCGTIGPFITHLTHVRDIVGKREDVKDFSSVTVLVLPEGTFFLCDSHVLPMPGVDDIVAMTLLAAEAVQRFGIKPRIALVSHSNFGTRNNESSEKMRAAAKILQEREPQLVVEGEMHADAAISEAIRANAFPNSKLRGRANTLVLPNIDAANISFNLLKMLGGGVTVGPVLVGSARPAHILTNASTAHGIVNMSALAVVEAQSRTLA